MTLEEGRQLLTGEGIPFEELRFENERAYWADVSFWDNGNPGKEEPVTVLRIPAPNGRRHLDLQFLSGEFLDLWFGGFSYEMWENLEKALAGDILDCIRTVREQGYWCMIRVDAEQGFWQGDACSDPEEYAMGDCLQKLRTPKGFWARLLNRRFLYEVYDWNEYHRIER